MGLSILFQIANGSVLSTAFQKSPVSLWWKMRTNPTKVQVCIDYRKLNVSTRKDHFSLPFIDQMLERLAGREHYCFLDLTRGGNQFFIALEDQAKIMFTYPFDLCLSSNAFRFCNALAIFKCCMLSLFYDMWEWFLETFMNEFSIYGDSFDYYLHHLELVLQCYIEKNLTLNWEKCHSW